MLNNATERRLILRTMLAWIWCRVNLSKLARYWLSIWYFAFYGLGIRHWDTESTRSVTWGRQESMSVSLRKIEEAWKPLIFITDMRYKHKVCQKPENSLNPVVISINGSVVRWHVIAIIKRPCNRVTSFYEGRWNFFSPRLHVLFGLVRITEISLS